MIEPTGLRIHTLATGLSKMQDFNRKFGSIKFAQSLYVIETQIRVEIFSVVSIKPSLLVR